MISFFISYMKRSGTSSSHQVIVFSSLQNCKSLNIPHCYILSSRVINNSSTLGFSFMSVFVFVFLVLNFNINLKEFFLFSLWSSVVESSSAASAKCESYQNQRGLDQYFVHLQWVWTHCSKKQTYQGATSLSSLRDRRKKFPKGMTHISPYLNSSSSFRTDFFVIKSIAVFS